MASGNALPSNIVKVPASRHKITSARGIILGAKTVKSANLLPKTVKRSLIFCIQGI
jgi:hypothetical protein